MKSVFLFLLLSFCFGCSRQTTGDKVQNESPTLASTPITSATAAVPYHTPQDLPINIGSTYTAKGIEAKLGVVSLTDAGFGCLRILNASLKASEEFYVVAPFESPHEISKLRIKEKLAKSCVDDSSDIGDGERVLSNSSYYLAELVASDNEYSTWWSGIAVVGISKAPDLDNGIATAELTGSPPFEYFRECTGNESMHFTVWTGKPLIGKRIWYRYIYLEYGTVPTCNKKDYEKTDE